MRDASDDLARYLLESMNYRLIVDAFYGDERTLVSIPVTDWDLTWDLETATKSAGTLTIQSQDDQGNSLVPKQLTDPLAPFGQQVAVLIQVSFGDLFNETVMLGRYRIDSAPQSTEDHFGFAGQAYVLDSTIRIEIADLLTIPAGWSFRGPSVPKYTSSTWRELRSISTLPVDASLPDRATPGNLVYQPGQSGRLTAIQQLVRYLGGIPVTNEYGELTAVPLTTGDAVNTLELGTRGTVIDIASDLQSGQVVNEVCGEYQDDDGVPIYVWAVVDSGPLATTGEFKTRTAPTDNDDTVTTVTAARTRIRKVLQQYLNAHTVRYTLTCLFDPRAQIGDVVDVNGPRARINVSTLSDPAWTLRKARIVSIRAASSTVGVMTVVLDVGAGLNASIRVGP